MSDEPYKCGKCNKPMRFNVPRLGPDGGFVHADTGSLLCDELKPCPFCGRPAEIRRKGTSRQSMLYGCTECHAELECGDVYGLTAPERYGWNQRVNMP